jgi:hypothetical protein
MKQAWKTPVLEVLNVEQTMAQNVWWGADEAYNDQLPHDQQTGPHHGS